MSESRLGERARGASHGAHFLVMSFRFYGCTVLYGRAPFPAAVGYEMFRSMLAALSYGCLPLPAWCPALSCTSSPRSDSDASARRRAILQGKEGEEAVQWVEVMRGASAGR